VGKKQGTGVSGGWGWKQGLESLHAVLDSSDAYFDACVDADLNGRSLL
jgi:hypothetical protein